jgi:hypothetical protein
MWNDYDSNSAYGYDSDYGGGNRRNDYTPVTFYRPDGDTEGKDVQWCLDNGFFHIEEDLWSGNWYYRHFPDKRPKECPVGGCKKQFKTSEKLDVHLRHNQGAAHDRYRKDKDIIFGPTAEEKTKTEAKEAKMVKKRRDDKRAELLDTVVNGLYDGISENSVKQARKELQKMDEEEYEFPCTVQQCGRKFKAQVDLHEHLEESKGKGHQQALITFEKDFALACPADGCQRRFMEELSRDMHYMSLGIARLNDGHPDEAHARAYTLALAS